MLFTEWEPKKLYLDRGDGHLPFDDIRRKYRWDRETQTWIRKLEPNEFAFLRYLKGYLP